MSYGLDKLYILFDSARCHLTKKVEDYLTKNNIDSVIIPPRLTNLLQPAAGNIKSPGSEQIKKWLSQTNQLNKQKY